MAADVSLHIPLDGAADALCNGETLQQNEHEQPKRLVLKFGGTVCGRLPVEVADICLAALSEGPIAVVCSARSGKTKVEGTTNLLLKAEIAASKPGTDEYIEIVSDVLRQHVEGTTILSPKAAAKLVVDLTRECNDLQDFLAGLPKTSEKDPKSIGRELDPESKDRIICVGERLSARFMTALLEDKGTPAEYVDLSRARPPDSASRSQSSPQESYQDVSRLVGRRIKACGDKVPVLTGFFGAIPGGTFNHCGRGYSDLLAAIAAGGVNARELQIWKEVPGVFTADPRKVPTATLLPSITPSEAEELTFFGSEVLHQSTIEQCIPRVPIRIKDVRSPTGQGTIISIDEERKKDPLYDQRPKRPTAVTVKGNITIVNILPYRRVGSPEFLAQICSTLAQHSVTVDLFELNQMHVSLAIHSKSPFVTMTGQKDPEDLQSEHKELQSAITELRKYGSVEVKPKMAILSLIGEGLKQTRGMAGKFFSALGDGEVNIEMISQGASEINISCVITERNALRALNIVHTALFTFLE